MTRRKKNISNIEEIKIRQALNSLQSNGYLNFREEKNGSVSLEINGQAALDYFDNLGEIPLPIQLYKKLNEDNTGNYYDNLSSALAIFYFFHNKENRDLELIPDSIEVDQDEFEFIFNMIFEFYDLDNPKTNTGTPFYWFHIKDSIVDKFKNVAKQQKMNDFPRYFLR